jgi:hypothetical protein
MWGYFRKRSVPLIVAAAALLVSIGGVAYATIPDGNGVISACYDNGSGDLRVIDAEAGDSCRADETPIEWTQKGGGGTTYNYRSQQSSTGMARAFCVKGEKVSGGGAFTTNNGAGLIQNYPISDASGVIAWGTTAIGWQAAVENFNGTVVAFVICAS